MGIEIPGELANLLNELGYTWPKADETQLLDMGREWMSWGDKLRPIVQDARQVANQVTSTNKGNAVEAFGKAWEKSSAAAHTLDQGSMGATAIGGALLVCAGIVVALKINVIVQLTTLLIEIIQAIASAAVTFGASLLEIPVFKKITDMAVNFLINKAMEVVLGG
jgi:hypothetical protein